jgi:UDP-glucose 4-epimerase
MRNVLVTGASGYIGQNVVKRLDLAGYTPICIDLNISKHNSKYDQYILNIKDSESIGELCRKYKPIGAIHLAADIYVDESIRNPKKYYRNNISNSIVFLSTLLNNNVNKVIYSSTCCVYDCTYGEKLTEYSRINPINPYGFSKYTIEQCLKDYDKAYNFKSIILRYFNVAGANEELGENHKIETHLVPNLIKNKEFNLYGDENITRDFIHVIDIADAHILSLDYLLRNQESNIFNVGSENGYSIKQIIDTVENIMNRKIIINNCPPRDGDAFKIIADSSKIKEVLNWTAKNSNIETIISSAVKYHVEYNQ